ncbi:MAG: histidinol-phosphate transaminase [Deltaproteobacteria bacterium]|nr:histidinol-phosphate transaminase [Deltaproteobacteria bacterium]
MSMFWTKVVKKLTPYVPGEQPRDLNIIKLNTNESPYSPSPKVIEALIQEAGSTLRLYPDPDCSSVKTAVADYYGIDASQVFAGNGSDEVLAHCFQGLLKHSKPLLFPDITYSFYPVYCELYDIEYETVPLTDSFKIRLRDYLRPNGGIIFANPNAPTGCIIHSDDIINLLEKNDGSVVVIDEAYIDFGGESSVRLINRFPNLLVIQTLSKSRALAGLRVGFAIGNQDLISALEMIKNSFNSYPLDRFAIAGAIAALKDIEYFEKIRNMIINTRNNLSVRLQRIGFEVLPSSSNFLFVRHPSMEAKYLYSKLREKSIIVRHFNHPRIKQFLRITVGNPDQCKALVSALNEIVGIPS